MKHTQPDELKDSLRWIKNNDRVAYYCFLYIFKNPLSNGLDWTVPYDLKPYIDHSSLVMPPLENNNTVTLDVITNSFSFPDEKINATGSGYNPNMVKLDDSSSELIDELTGAFDVLGGNMCSDFINGLSILSSIDLGASSKDIYQKIYTYYLHSNGSFMDKIKHISKMEKAWRNCFNSYPDIFSWLDHKNEEQILWVWNYFKVKMMRIPFEPIDSTQRYNLIVSSFDLWDGWSDEQRAFLNKKRKHPLNKTNTALFEPSPNEHKNIFLSEIDKARRQQKFRDQRKVKKESNNLINISGSYMSKLKLLSEHLKLDNDKVIKMLIDERLSKILKNG